MAETVRGPWGPRQVAQFLWRNIPKKNQTAILRGVSLLTRLSSPNSVEARMRRRAKNPVTFSEKVRYKMAFDRRPLLTTLADKYAARAFIEDCVGSRYLVPLLWSGESASAVPWDSLPREFVAKVNHGSGGMVIVDELADPTVALPPTGSKTPWERFVVHPDQADPSRMADLLRHWLTLDFSRRPGRDFIEWCYRNIPRRIVVEKLLRDDAGHLPTTYRFWMLDGEVLLIRASAAAQGPSRATVETLQFEELGELTADWEPAPFVIDFDAMGHNSRGPERPPRPRQFDDMVRIAKTISAAAGDFLRVDFFEVGDALYVGELTNYPSGGGFRLLPRSYDEAFGELWNQRY